MVLWKQQNLQIIFLFPEKPSVTERMGTALKKGVLLCIYFMFPPYQFLQFPPVLLDVPPPRRDKDLPSPASLDALYRSWASSTWIFPSPDTARAAKISRIKSVLSIILHESSSSRLPNCALVSSSSQIIPVASVSHRDTLASSTSVGAERHNQEPFSGFPKNCQSPTVRFI